jgi:hypothetical protein
MNITAELIELGPARPESHEITWKLIYDTDPDLFDYYFKSDRERMKLCLSDWWQRPEGWFSHSACTAATYDGSLVGIETGFTREDFQKDGNGSPGRNPDAISRKKLRYIQALSDEESTGNDKLKVI